MTLGNFLAVISNKDVYISVVNVEGDEIIKFLSSGYAGVESDVLDREVKKVTINGSQNMVIIIKDAATTAETNEESGEGGA